MNETIEEAPCERCGDGDRVPQGYWVCPKCDAEWLPQSTEPEQDTDE